MDMNGLLSKLAVSFQGWPGRTDSLFSPSVNINFNWWSRMKLALPIMLALLAFSLIASADVGGTWKICGFGADSMVLAQSDNHVYGTYNTHQGQGIIDGYTNAQNVWTGTWTEPFNDDWGYFSAAFSNDTSRLYGSWKYAEGGDYEGYWDNHGNWDGSFQGVKLQANATTNT